MGKDTKMENILSNIQKETLKRLYNQDSYLTIMLSIDEIFSNIHLYGYKNWFDGEIFEGPNVSKFWIEIKILYDYDEKPDINGFRTLKKHNIKSSMKEIVILEPREIEKYSDYRDGTRKPKIDKHKAWLVTINIPRHLVSFDDTFNINDKISQDIMTQIVTSGQADEELENEFDQSVE